ncbi:hypothetical protein Hanom_Chr07g00620421 [Helianthus anomalus]
MAWKPKLDGDNFSVEEDLDNESMEESDESSVERGGEDDCNMEDEVEDGKIRSLEQKSPVPVVEGRSPSVSPMDLVTDQSPEYEKSDPERLHEVHVESSNLKVFINGIVESENVAAGVNECGPHPNGACGNTLVDQISKDDPTPLVRLGKRNRANRSPPSFGSMQGPPTRSFYQDCASDEFSFDLNRPTSDFGTLSGEPVGGVTNYQESDFEQGVRP